MKLNSIFSPTPLLIIISLIVAQHNVFAEAQSNTTTDLETTEQFFYLGGKLGANHYQNGCQSWSIECDKTDTAGGLYAGYQFNQHFALETAYLHLGDAVAVYPIGGLNQTYTGTMQGIELSAVGLLPLTERFSLFAKGGLYNWYATNESLYSNNKESGISPTAGLGLSYQLTNSLQARLEYQYFYELGDEEIGGSHGHLTTLGLAYQFGRVKPAPVVKQVYVPIELETFSFAVLFDFAKSEVLLPDDLQQVIKRLTTYPQATVELSGYADDKGTETFNIELSKTRVKHISDYLIKQGVKPTQIIEHYLGEAEPVIVNDSAEHRHLNRHVQVVMPTITIHPTQEEK